MILQAESSFRLLPLRGQASALFPKKFRAEPPNRADMFPKKFRMAPPEPCGFPEKYRAVPGIEKLPPARQFYYIFAVQW